MDFSGIDLSHIEAKALMDYKASPAQFKALDQGEYEGHFAIIGNVDDGRDRILPGAFKKTLRENAKRVKVFYAHDWNKLIGPTPRKLEEDAKGLFAAGRLTLESFWGREAWVLMRDEALTEGSIGYKTVKAYAGEDEDGPVRNIKELKLYEISPVPLGMNAQTVIRAVKLANVLSVKRAIPPHTTPKADEDEDWDAAAVLKQIEGARQLRLIHAWVDDDGDPDAKQSYKLPHHLADGRVVWRGVAAAAAALQGGRGGVDIPQADVPGVRRHLARHYEQFDRTPPWEETSSLDGQIETLCAILDAVRDERAFVTCEPQARQRLTLALKALLEDIGELSIAVKPDRHLTLIMRAELAERALRLAVLDS